MYEPHFNLSILSEKVIYRYQGPTKSCSAIKSDKVWSLHLLACVQLGDLQSSYSAAQKSEDAFPEHVDTQQLLKQLRQHFAVLWGTTALQTTGFSFNPVFKKVIIW